jgi:hypothetical protein
VVLERAADGTVLATLGLNSAAEQASDSPR